MADRERNRRENDARQSSEVDAALGEDERAFGAGGQRTSGPLNKNDAANRDVDRDPTLPEQSRQEVDQ